MLIALTADSSRLRCMGDFISSTKNRIEVLRTINNIIVICICSFSLVLCSRSLVKAFVLGIETIGFFRSAFGRELSWKGRMEFVNIWYLMIVANDILLITGSMIKEHIERSMFSDDDWNVCSVILGLGNMLVWFGLLRYLGFFDAFNVMILTLKMAAPKIWRFMMGALLIYMGYAFCGWLVLAPYHIKFQTWSVTAECLFSMINGDELYATFANMVSNSRLLWWFSRIYLYSFICLYIYVVLSLFISVILDAYDTVKKCYRYGFPQNDLRAFIGATNNSDEGVSYADFEADEHSLYCFNGFCKLRTEAI